jgi:hypothetical protein
LKFFYSPKRGIQLSSLRKIGAKAVFIYQRRQRKMIVMSLKAPEAQVTAVKERLIELGFSVHEIWGVERLVLGAVGDGRLDEPSIPAAYAGSGKGAAGPPSL